MSSEKLNKWKNTYSNCRTE